MYFLSHENAFNQGDEIRSLMKNDFTIKDVLRVDHHKTICGHYTFFV